MVMLLMALRAGAAFDVPVPGCWASETELSLDGELRSEGEVTTYLPSSNLKCPERFRSSTIAPVPVVVDPVLDRPALYPI